MAFNNTLSWIVLGTPSSGNPETEPAKEPPVGPANNMCYQLLENTLDNKSRIDTLTTGSDHLTLQNLQGGNSTERYHLDLSQHTDLTSTSQASQNTLISSLDTRVSNLEALGVGGGGTSNHNDLLGLQGGDALSRYHLSEAQYLDLTGTTQASQNTAINDTVTSLNSTISTVNTHTTDITNLSNTVSSLSSTVSGYSTSISDLQTSDTAQDTAISSLQTSVSNIVPGKCIHFENGQLQTKSLSGYSSAAYLVFIPSHTFIGSYRVPEGLSLGVGLSAASSAGTGHTFGGYATLLFNGSTGIAYGTMYQFIKNSSGTLDFQINVDGTYHTWNYGLIIVYEPLNT